MSSSSPRTSNETDTTTAPTPATTTTASTPLMSPPIVASELELPVAGVDAVGEKMGAQQEQKQPSLRSITGIPTTSSLSSAPPAPPVPPVPTMAEEAPSPDADPEPTLPPPPPQAQVQAQVQAQAQAPTSPPTTTTAATTTSTTAIKTAPSITSVPATAPLLQLSFPPAPPTTKHPPHITSHSTGYDYGYSLPLTPLQPQPGSRPQLPFQPAPTAPVYLQNTSSYTQASPYGQENPYGYHQNTQINREDYGTGGYGEEGEGTGWLGMIAGWVEKVNEGFVGLVEGRWGSRNGSGGGRGGV